MKHKIGIAGTGFVGSAVSTCFELLLKGKIEIREYDKFKNTESLESVVKHSEVIFVCLPTPMQEDGRCDTSIVDSVCHEIDSLSRREKTIVIKSTVSPGTTNKLAKKYKNHNFIFNPEHLTEKKFIEDFLNQDRIILGLTDKGQSRELDSLYHDFVSSQIKPAKIAYSSATEAEISKYVNNCFLATKISFLNEIYEICEASGVSYDKVVELAKMDKRFGESHTKVPCGGDYGFSGKCFPKDLNSLIYYAKSLDLDPLVLESVWSKNLLVRSSHDWEDIPGATTQNMNFKKE